MAVCSGRELGYIRGEKENVLKKQCERNAEKRQNKRLPIVNGTSLNKLNNEHNISGIITT